MCCFVSDTLDCDVLKALAAIGVELVALRCTGFNNVNLSAAEELNIQVARVPAYSPHTVAEHTLALLLSLTRNIHRAYNRVREGNFALEGLLGFDLFGKTIGIVGTGAIGSIVAQIAAGFGCQVIAVDPTPDPECIKLGVTYVTLSDMCRCADILTLHCPLTPATKHLISDVELEQMKPGVTIINTSRGAVLDTAAVIRALKNEKIGALGLDVYEEEGDLFFNDLSAQIIQDDIFARLLTFPNVLITGHQGFFTHEAMTAISETTIANLTSFAQNRRAVHVLPAAGNIISGFENTEARLSEQVSRSQ